MLSLSHISFSFSYSFVLFFSTQKYTFHIINHFSVGRHFLYLLDISYLMSELFFRVSDNWGVPCVCKLVSVWADDVDTNIGNILMYHYPVMLWNNVTSLHFFFSSSPRLTNFASPLHHYSYLTTPTPHYSSFTIPASLTTFTSTSRNYNHGKFKWPLKRKGRREGG